MAPESLGDSPSTSIRSACCNSGRRLGGCMEPETSIRKTRLAGGRLFSANSMPLMPMRARRWVGAQGQSLTSTLTERVLAGRWRIVVVEVIDQLLDAYGVAGGQPPS